LIPPSKENMSDRLNVKEYVKKREESLNSDLSDWKNEADKNSEALKHFAD